MNIKQIIFILGTIIVSVNSINVIAENLDAITARDIVYTSVGVIDDVRVDEGVIIIDDLLYRITPYAKIHSNSRYPGVFVAQSLGPGMIVGMNSVSGGLIDELWLLDKRTLAYE